MATPAEWPENVPTNILKDGFDPILPNTFLESEMERGHKLREISTGTPEIFKFKQRLTHTQLALLNTWREGDLRASGGLFLFPHPINKSVKTCQIIPIEGAPYKYSLAAGANWFVNWHIRVYP